MDTNRLIYYQHIKHAERIQHTSYTCCLLCIAYYNALSYSRLFSTQLGETKAIRLALETLDFPIPLVEVSPGIHVLELFHGPTHAFKDVGGQFMAGLMQSVGSPNSEKRTTTILVATSGDTGGAVARAFHGRPKTRVVVLFPDEGVSLQQRCQMSTLGDNVFAIAVAGTFDDCQELVKEAFASETLLGRDDRRNL